MHVVAPPLREAELYERSIEFKVMAWPGAAAYVDEFIRFATAGMCDRLESRLGPAVLGPV